jgi:hypothetical protein
MGRRCSNGPDWVGVWAMERRRDTWRPWAEQTRKEPAPRGPTLSCLFPPPTFLSLFPPHFLLFSPPLQAPPVFLSFVSRSAAAFQSAASFRKRIQHLRQSELNIPSSLFSFLYSLFSILYSLISNLYYLILYALIHSFSSLIFFSILLFIEWVQSVVRVVGCVFLSKCMHFSHFRRLLLFWSVSVAS